MKPKEYNILFVFNDRNLGGAGQSLLDALVSLKDSVNPIIAIREDALVVDRFVEAGVKYYKINFDTDYVKIGTANEKQRIQDFVQSYKAALKLLSIIKQEKIQLIHINSSSSYFAALTALMAGIPFVWHIRELMEEQFESEFLNEKIRVDCYRKADKLIAISDYVKEKYYEKYRLETTRIYNGLNIPRFYREIDANKSFNRTFLVAGVITPEKGQWDVIRAVESLCERGICDIKVIIVGGGKESYRWVLKKYIKKKNLEDNICMLPFCKNLSQLREQASYAITASQNEALGRVTIEAMLVGNFVIGARSGGTIEIIGENEERGFLYELHNYESLANTMIRAMECPREIKNRMTVDAQGYAEITFDSKRYCETLMELYQEIISAYKPKQYDVFLREVKEQYEHNKEKEVLKKEKESDIERNKVEKAYDNAVKWLQIRQRGYTLDEYFRKHQIQSIAIYGMALLGRRLYDELEDGVTEIKYLIDKAPGNMETVLDFVSLDGEKLKVDAIVVTVAGAERQIVEEIKGMGYQTVVGLSEILADFQD